MLNMEIRRCTTCSLLADSLVTTILVRCYPLGSFFHYHNQVYSCQRYMPTIFSNSMVDAPTTNFQLVDMRKVIRSSKVCQNKIFKYPWNLASTDVHLNGDKVHRFSKVLKRVYDLKKKKPPLLKTIPKIFDDSYAQKSLMASQAKTYGLNSLNILVKALHNVAIIPTIWSLKLLCQFSLCTF